MELPAALNFIKIQGHSLAPPAASRDSLVQSVLVGCALPRMLKEMLFMIARGIGRYGEQCHPLAGSIPGFGAHAAG